MSSRILKKVIGLCMGGMMIVGLVNPSFAQHGTDTGKTTLSIVSEGGVLVVKTFGIDFGTISPAKTNKTLTGTIDGNGGYLTVEDTIANTNWYVTVDATNMLMSGNSSTTISDGLLTMTSVGGAGAVTALSGGSTSEIIGVANTNVNFSGSNGFTVIQRTSFASGKIGLYGIQPSFKLNLPAFTPIGSYLGDFVATIYKS